MIGGTDIRDISQEDLRNLIGYAPQKSMLLSGTIRSNIAYGSDDISDDDANKCTKIAQAWDFIKKCQNYQ